MNIPFKKIDENPANKTLSLKQQLQSFFKRKENVVGFSVLATSISLVLVSVFFFQGSNFDNRQIALYTHDATPTPYSSCYTDANCPTNSLCKQIGSIKKCIPFEYPECRDNSTCQRANVNETCVSNNCVSQTVSCSTNAECNAAPNKPFCIAGTCQALSYPYCKINADCGTSQYCADVINGIGKCQFKVTPTPTKTQVNNTFSPTPVQSGGNQSQYCDYDSECTPAYKTYCANHNCVEVQQGYCKTDVHCSYLNNGKCVSGQCQVQQPDGSHVIPTATYVPEDNHTNPTDIPTRTPTPVGQSANNKVPTPTAITGDAGHNNADNTSDSQQGDSNSNAPANGQAGGEQSPIGQPGEATAQHSGENTFVEPTPVPIKNPIAKVANSVNKAIDSVTVSIAKFFINLFTGK